MPASLARPGAAALALCLAASPALAQTAAPTPPTSAPSPAPTVPVPAILPAATTVTLPAPGMSGPLALNPAPFSIDLGPAGKTYISGVISGLGLVQNNPVPGDKNGHIDLSNGQLIFQKIDGLVQYDVQIGGYSLPALGTQYFPVGRATTDLYGAVPEAFIKIAPTSNFSIEVGKLPTLIGAEYTFTFENMNIERGLLWNQEPAVSRGVQANYTMGPVAFSLSLNDGYYSDRFTWLSGSAVWTVNSANTMTFAAGGNAGSTSFSNLATPIPQNNSSIYNLIYTHTSGPWTITPYIQASHIPKNPAIGIAHDAETFGGAVLASYAFNSHYSLAGRVEYIASTGSLSNGSPNLLYGPGSKAMSLTLTPTYQYDRFFARAEFSFVKMFDSTAGFALGPNLNSTNQVRGLLETGVLF